MMSKAERERVEQLETKLRESILELSNFKITYQQEIEKLKKEIESKQSTIDIYRNSSTKVENELESAHSFLDGLPQSPARETEAAESYNRRQIPLTIRLATWIAKVAFSDALAKMGIK